MQELFSNIRQEVKDNAERVWQIACLQPDPAKAADFLNNATNYFRNLYTNEEIEFLQFYFKVKVMEMIRDD